MRRRKFLKVFSGISILALGTYAVAPTFHKTVKKILSDASENLKMDGSVIEDFLIEAKAEYYWEEFNYKQRIFIVFHKLIDNPLFTLPYIEKYNLYTNRIVTQFLLSTDFFIHKMDTQRNVKYTSFYNPFKNPCYNPFTNLHYNI